MQVADFVLGRLREWRPRRVYGCRAILIADSGSATNWLAEYHEKLPGRDSD